MSSSGLVVEVALKSELCLKKDEPPDASDDFVTPGDVLTRDSGFMRGHGTYTRDQVLLSSVAGQVRRVNRLISVIPPKTKYLGEVGDVIVGRITEVQQKRWKVEINSRLDALLQLSSVNLPGGELRRRSAEDELAMRKYLQEGDLISAEVQSIFSDGVVSLHTRSLKYGKLCQGTLLKVSPSLVKRRKTHFHTMPFGVSVILGHNGLIWLAPTCHDQFETTGGAAGGGFAQNLESVPRVDRLAICRLRNCIMALAAHNVMLWDTSLNHAYEASLEYLPAELLKPEAMKAVATVTKHLIERESLNQ